MSRPYRWARNREEAGTWILRRAGEDLAIAAPLGRRFYWYPVANFLPSSHLSIGERTYDSIETTKHVALAWVREKVRITGGGLGS